jgi:predicted GNAT family acetyltransferase
MDVVNNNKDAERFELTVDGQTAFSTYRERDNRISFLHTEVPEALRGGGVGGRLARAGLDYARAHKLEVVPHCPFIASYIKSHPEYADLVHTWPSPGAADA